MSLLNAWGVLYIFMLLAGHTWTSGVVQTTAPCWCSFFDNYLWNDNCLSLKLKGTPYRLLELSLWEAVFSLVPCPSNSSHPASPALSCPCISKTSVVLFRSPCLAPQPVKCLQKESWNSQWAPRSVCHYLLINIWKIFHIYWTKKG